LKLIELKILQAAKTFMADVFCLCSLTYSKPKKGSSFAEIVIETKNILQKEKGPIFEKGT
jgi:hypothetical protein